MLPVLACLSDEELIALADGRLEPEALHSLHAHIAQCRACRLLVAGLAKDESDSQPEQRSLLPQTESRAGAAAAVAAWAPPSRFAEFSIRGPLGRGTMGQVFAGHDVVLDRPVAVKFITSLDRADRDRFIVEARAVARLNHPNVVTLYRVGELEGRPYLVSELVQGQSLACLDVPLPWPRVLDIGVELAAGLTEAHHRGVVHRDIKPANVILSSSGVVKLLDFGLARLSHAPALEPDTGADPSGLEPSLTQTGALVGTPLYMSPEAWGGGEPRPQMDIYSLGALLYQLCTGEPPHRADSLLRLRDKVLKEAAPGLAAQVPGLDPGFAQVVDRCLDRDPAQRPPDGDALLRALLPLQRKVRQAVAEPDARSRRRRAWLLYALPGALALIAAAGVLSRRAPRDPPAGGMVRIPGGVLQMGSSPEEIAAALSYCRRDDGVHCASPANPNPYSREGPLRAVTVSPFQIDRTEVTVEAYVDWLNQTPGLRRAQRRDQAGDEETFVYSGDVPLLNLFMNLDPPVGVVYRDGRYQAAPGRGRHPVTQVTWEGALRYCQGRGLSLPTEAQWEFTARGPARRPFPWGTAPPRCEGVVFARLSEPDRRQPCAHLGLDHGEVGAAADDRTDLGVRDLAGNVAEWVMDGFQPYAAVAAPGADPLVDPPPATETRRVIRGGSYSDAGATCRGAARGRLPPDLGFKNVGFRCASGGRPLRPAVTR